MTAASPQESTRATREERRSSSVADRIPARASGPWSLALAAWLLLGGIAIGYSAIVTILVFAWPHPAFDQFRLYPIYLEQPFPLNVLELENQHRPVFPGLVRVVEIHWLAANQRLQIGFGLACAVSTALLVAATALRERAITVPARAAGAAGAVIAVFWLANARMLMHGHELVHVYLLTLALMTAGLAAWRAGHGAPLRWLVLASVAATIATFSFGPGIALFPAIAVLAWVQRVPLRAWIVPGIAFISCLVLYLYVLPGDRGARATLALRPWETLDTAARWIASPWMHAWLGFADPPLNARYAEILAPGPGRAWVASANWVQQVSGLQWSQGLALLLGAGGFAFLALRLLQALRDRAKLSATGALGLTLALFGAASAFVIGIGRLDYFAQHPDQVFADRYLVWPCLFWLGLLLLLLAPDSRWPRLRRVAVAAMCLLPLALWPSHKLAAGWAATVHRHNQASAAAAISDVYDDRHFRRDDASAPVADQLRTLDLLKRRGLAMFALPGARYHGMQWADGPVSEGATASVSRPVPVRDLRDARPAARFSATLVGVPARAADLPLVVLDQRGRVVGHALPAFVAGPHSSLRWTRPVFDGYEGYIGGYDPGASYRLVRLDPDRGQAERVAQIPR
jgi:hypothetical protein